MTAAQVTTNNHKINFIGALLVDMYDIPSTWQTLSAVEVQVFKNRIEQASTYVKELRDVITDD